VFFKIGWKTLTANKFSLFGGLFLLFFSLFFLWSKLADVHLMEEKEQLVKDHIVGVDLMIPLGKTKRHLGEKLRRVDGVAEVAFCFIAKMQGQFSGGFQKEGFIMGVDEKTPFGMRKALHFSSPNQLIVNREALKKGGIDQIFHPPKRPRLKETFQVGGVPLQLISQIKTPMKQPLFYTPLETALTLELPSQLYLLVKGEKGYSLRALAQKIEKISGERTLFVHDRSTFTLKMQRYFEKEEIKEAFFWFFLVMVTLFFFLYQQREALFITYPLFQRKIVTQLLAFQLVILFSLASFSSYLFHYLTEGVSLPFLAWAFCEGGILGMMVPFLLAIVLIKRGRFAPMRG